MVLRHDQGKFIRAKTLVTKIRRMAGQKTEANIHAAFFKRRFNLSGRDFFDGNADCRMIGDECAEKLRNQRHIQHWNNTYVQCTAQFCWFTVEFVEKILHLMKERPGVLLKNQTSRSEQDPLPAALERGTRRPFSKSRICCETLGCEIPSRSAARLKFPASATARKYRRWRMSKGSDMREAYCSADFKCNQELDPECVRG